MADHPFVALVTPLAHGLLITPLSGHVEHPIAPGGPPPSVGDHPMPTPPIAPGGPPPTVGGGPIVPPGVWPPPGHPDHDLPLPPPSVDNTLPGAPPDGALIVVWVPGVGLKWAKLGTSVDNTLPTPPPTVNPTPPDQPPPVVGGGPITPPPTVNPPTVDNTLPTPPPTPTPAPGF